MSSLLNKHYTFCYYQQLQILQCIDLDEQLMSIKTNYVVPLLIKVRCKKAVICNLFLFLRLKI